MTQTEPTSGEWSTPVEASSAAAPAARRSGLAVAVQLTIFAASLGVLGWCIWLATRKPEYAEQFQRLLAAPWPVVAGLLALSGLTTVLSGLVFWCVLLPVRRLKALDCVAVNAMATLLGYAPLKLGLVARVVVHSRRDGMPLALIAAWVAATGVVLMVSLAPPIAATLWRGGLDGWWWAAAIGGLAVLAVAMVAVSRWASGERGWMLLQRLAAATRSKVVGRMAASDAARKLHAATEMLGSPRSVALALGLRAADVAAQSLRFLLAGEAVGVSVTAEQAVIAGAAYFILQAVSPAGTLGVREGGTAGVLAVIHSPEMLLLVLVVSMAQAAVDIVLGLSSVAWLRVDRLMRGGGRKLD